MAPLTPTQHRIAFILLIASLAFAATTVFMLCLLQPKAADAGTGKSAKKMNHNNGEEAYAALAGLPIRKRQVLDDGTTNVDALKQIILAQHGDAQRHGGSVLPANTRPQLDQGLHAPPTAQSGRNFPWQRAAVQDERKISQAILLVDGSTLRPVADVSCDEGESEEDGLLRIKSGLPCDADQVATVNIEQAKQAAHVAGLAPGFLLDVPHPFGLRS